MVSERVAVVLRSVAANVRAARRRRVITQEQLAEAADIDLRHLQRVERGTANLTIAVLVALADALRVAPGLLLRRARLPKARMGRPRRAGAPGASTRHGA
ncbi:MAG: helix-turn-helix transcriptional regulator [Deltaproteobacteria bacterium]|nr:helix-turn-helix transcriptional regulator [Deltaproteobacteria bacterium]